MTLAPQTPGSSSEGSFFTKEAEPKLPPQEVLRRKNVEHAFKTASRIEDGIQGFLAKRNPDAAHARNCLRNGTFLARDPLGVQTLNAVERCLLSDAEGKREVAYLKSEHSEPFFKQNTTGGIDFYKHLLDQDGFEQSVSYTPNSNIRGFLEHSFKARSPIDSAMRSEMGALYQIDPDKIPLSKTEYTGRYMDTGHVVRSEYASSVLDTLVGFGSVPQTVAREDKVLTHSLQQHQEGTPLTYEVLDSIASEGSKHPAIPSLMRLSCLDYLIRSSDRHSANLIYHKDTQTFHGIDNGLANGFSIQADIPQADGTTHLEAVPADGFLSAPMEITEQYPDLKLDDKAVEQCKALFDRIKLYLLYREGMLHPALSDALPEDVKNGRDAKILSDTYRLLFERTDENGDVIPETTAIAHREALEFLRRLNHLIAHRQPPKLSDDHHSRIGIATIMQARQKTAQAQPIAQ